MTGKNNKPRPAYKLEDVRAAIDAGRFKFINREKNLLTLEDLGITPMEVARHVYSLRPAHFFAPALKTASMPADVYKKTIDGMTVYIKFYLDEDVVVISFHEDEI